MFCVRFCRPSDTGCRKCLTFIFLETAHSPPTTNKLLLYPASHLNECQVQEKVVVLLFFATSTEERCPLCAGFLTAHPKHCRYSHYQRHEILHEKQQELGAVCISPLETKYKESKTNKENRTHPAPVSFKSYAVGAGNAIFLTSLVDPGVLPGTAAGLFVQVTPQQRQQREKIETAENSDANHELLQLLLVPFVVLDHLTHVVQRHYPGQQQREPGQHGYGQRSHNEPAQRRQVIETHETHAADTVSLHFVQRQQSDRECSGKTPGHCVEPHSLFLDGFTAPLGPSSQKPGDGQNDPPDHPGSGEEIQQHEEQRAGTVLSAQHHRGRAARHAAFDAGRLVTQQKTHEINERDKTVAHSVKDDGPLWVAEPLHINEES